MSLQTREWKQFCRDWQKANKDFKDAQGVLEGLRREKDRRNYNLKCKISRVIKKLFHGESELVVGGVALCSENGRVCIWFPRPEDHNTYEGCPFRIQYQSRPGLRGAGEKIVIPEDTDLETVVQKAIDLLAISSFEVVQ